jgi:hypothetical protein
MIGRGPGGRLDLRVELAGSERQWLTPATVVRGRDLLEAARTLADGDLFASVPPTTPPPCGPTSAADSG